ncbi:Protein of unknown function, partial [Cotesia congregata]
MSDNNDRLTACPDLFYGCHRSSQKNYNISENGKRDTRDTQALGGDGEYKSNIAILNTYGEKFISLSHRVVGGDLGHQHQVAAIKWQDMESAFQDSVKTGCVINLRHTDLKAFLREAENMAIEKIQQSMQEHGSLKVYTQLLCRFENHKNDAVVVETKSFQTKASTILANTELHEWFQDNVTDQLLKKIEDFNENQSGWEAKEDDEKDPSIIVPLYLSSNLDCQKDTIHLLMIETNITLNDDDDSIENHRPIFHFAFIKNLSRLVKSSITKGKTKLFFCDLCLCHFKLESSYQRHYTD